ncbi:hypothetical protein SAMN05660297_01298 [Natronincola peptidivorans]|uniref:Uncharacterized protein n=1 Tax=Natronincola peptidivorans TaxID=426128 RepID=A0A1I0BJD8_9FIRM|nr:hypothetical protein [Natronincola peptidivorans]SET07028.1 hypothetical protein SAMN05660297_01298 [Natronincola peptidivorans]
MDNFAIILTSVIAGMIAYYISNGLGKGAVFGSAIVTLTAGLFLPHFVPTIGGTLAVMATCAGYAGMVAAKNAKNLSEMAIIGLINGILFIVTLSAYPGVGGRLGVVGAIACLVWMGMKKAYAMASKPNTAGEKETDVKPVN